MGSLENWSWGEDDTGNLLSRTNLEGLVKRAKKVLDTEHCS